MPLQVRLEDVRANDHAASSCLKCFRNPEPQILWLVVDRLDDVIDTLTGHTPQPQAQRRHFTDIP